MIILFAVLALIGKFLFYDSQMTRDKLYECFIADYRNENPHEITSKFRKDLSTIEQQIVEMDCCSTRKKGNNKLVRLSFQTNYSVSGIKTIKRNMITRLQIFVCKYYIRAQ